MNQDECICRYYKGKKMGTGHVLLHKIVIERLKKNEFADTKIIAEGAHFEGDLYNVMIESHQLPEGYNGQLEMWIKDDGTLGFRRETDT